MTRTVHTILQVLGFIISAGTMATGIVPAKYQPYVVLVVSAAQGALAWYNHNFNPDGTPASVAYVAKLLILFLLLGSSAMAQANPPTPSYSPLFSVSTQAVAVRIGGQTVPGTDAVGSFNLTPRLQLQTDNTLAPANNFQQYVAGPKYYPALLEKPFAKTSLAGIKPYIHTAIGIVRNVPPTGPSTQHYSANAGGGFDWIVNGTFSLGPVVEYMNAPSQCSPGVPHCSPHGGRVSANLTFVLGKK